ncbi:amino acid permease [Liquorilactobacillus oeni]|uniref:APC family amino acid transporter n=1 Tax=Liquorilactobacillus oeni DSM 19972 TaxID=1423777 RepID=A0A0R1M7T1_9LACO|nr:amino acid permease [Liquorilactobacillus oeni]KRL03985.1 APC family amino acid transporter [Liquorilactobacillus oeni DSM 19972]
MSTENKFSRSLKSRHVQLIALGGTIGTGLFLGAGKTIHLAGPSIVFAYLFTGIICFLLMRALGELLLSDLDSHSFIDFITKYLGKEAGFVTGWTYWACWITIAMADVTASGLYFKYWFPNVPQWLPGFIILLILLIMNLITVGLFGEAEFWFALIKIVAICLLIIAGLVMVVFGFQTPVGYAGFHNLFSDGGIFPTGLRGFLSSFQMVTFGFIGIELIGVTASETENPKHVIPKAINEIPIRVILFYVGSLIALMCIYPWNKIAEDQSPFVQVFQNIGIPAAAGIINFVVLTAAASACNSSLFSTGRMLFSLNYRNKSKFALKMSTLSRRQVPANGLIFSSIVIGIAVLANFIFSNTALFTFISSVATTCFLFIWGMIILAHLQYRRSNTEKSFQFKVPFYPWSDYLVLAFLFFVAGSMFLNTTSLWALGVAVLWLLFLWVGRHLKKII